MSPVERVRRWRTRLVEKATAEAAATIRELEAENKRLRVEAGASRSKAPSAAGWERVRKAWLDDHPASTAADFDRATSCSASNEEGAAIGKWFERRVRVRPAEAESVSPPPETAALQRQLTAARTQIRNLKAELRAMVSTLDLARRANPTIFTKAEINTLRKALHPDGEASTASPSRARLLNEAAAIFNAKKFNVTKE
jgi:hypothetical protein